MKEMASSSSLNPLVPVPRTTYLSSSVCGGSRAFAIDWVVALYEVCAYNAAVAAASNAKVSHRGQTSLPAELRHRWGIDEGGEVGFIDLGDAALIVPGGVTAARRELRRVLADRYEQGVAALADPDLVDQ